MSGLGSGFGRISLAGFSFSFMTGLLFCSSSLLKADTLSDTLDLGLGFDLSLCCIAGERIFFLPKSGGGSVRGLF